MGKKVCVGGHWQVTQYADPCCEDDCGAGGSSATSVGPGGAGGSATETGGFGGGF